jgi:hypothetical protein
VAIGGDPRVGLHRFSLSFRSSNGAV